MNVFTASILFLHCFCAGLFLLLVRLSSVRLDDSPPTDRSLTAVSLRSEKSGY